MARKIDSLLAKKGWTGEEVGKALVASLLNDIKNQGKADYEPLFTQKDFDKMESSLQTDKDFLAYGVYRDIYSSIVDTFNRGQGLYQQFYNGYYRYLMNLRGAMSADEALADMEKYPLIMSEEQYKRIEAETANWLRGLKTSYYSLVFDVLSSCLSALEAGKAEEVPAPILKAIEATKKEPATNKRILALYNEDMGEGYYTLPDGRRSDELSKEEWEQALQELYLETHKLTLNGQPASPEDTVRHYSGERLLSGIELFFKGEDAIREAYKEKTGRELDEGDATDILAELESLIDGAGKQSVTPLRNELYTLYADETPTEWHYYEEAPEGLTKYDIISSLLDRYSGVIEGDIPEKDQLKEFKKDYPALYSALDAYIKECVPRAKSIKPAQMYRESLTAGELADGGVIGFAGFEVSDFNMISYLQSKGACKFADAKRATLRGIAVVKNPRWYQLTESGDYKEDANPLDRLESLDSLAEDEGKRAEIERLRDALFIPALKYLYGFNAIIAVVGEVYDIDGIEVAQFDTSLLESQLQGFNGSLYSFYYAVYGDKEEKARKRELIKELFQPVDAEAQKPPAEAVERARAELIKAGISTTARKTLKHLDNLIEELYHGEGAY